MKQFRVVTGILCLLAATCALLLFQVHFTNLPWQHELGLLTFFALFVLLESKPLILPGTDSRLSASGLISYAVIFLFPPFYSAILTAAGILVAEKFVERKPALKYAFNTSQVLLSTAVAALIVRAVIPATSGWDVPAQITGTAIAVVTYFMVNTTLVSIGLAPLTGVSFSRLWLGNYKWELVYMIGTIPIAIGLVYSYQKLWLFGPLLFAAPLFLVREAYNQHVKLKNTLHETVRTLIKVIETHDTYTAGHSQRVATYAKKLAVAAKLRLHDIENIEIAAYLHDLGKVDLAITHLVRKPGRLTPEEKRRVQLHPLVSADLSAQVTYFRGEIEEIIRHHHEHFNGTGYPRGLSGEEIPLGARIILIADAFDAMTSNRMYRSALDVERVRAEFVKYAGIQFDPELVELFLTEVLDGIATSLRQEEVRFEEMLSPRRLEPVEV